MSNPAESPRRRRRWPWVVAGLVLLLLGIQFWPRPLRPGPDTTVITGPLRADGSIDYPAALNEICAQDVTPENNAAVLLVQAIGPAIVEPELRREFFDKLGIPLPPDEGEYLQPLDQHFIADVEVLKRVQDEMGVCNRAPWQPADHPEIARWLAANEEPLELCLAASERSRFYLPLVVPPGGAMLQGTLPLTGHIRWVSRLLAARVTLRLGSGDVDGALADVNALRRLARHVSHYPALIMRLIAYALEAQASNGDAAIIQSGLLNAERARRQRQTLEDLPRFPPLADFLDHGERYLSLDITWSQLKSPTWYPLSHDLNALYRRINAAYDGSVAALGQKTLSAQRAELAAVAARLKTRAAFGWPFVGRLILGPRSAVSERIGDTLSALLVPALEQAAIADARARLKLQLSTVGYALAEYKAVHGAYPETLDALVPDLLESVPADPFGAGPIHYVLNTERGTFLLYGVGPNGRDDQGRQSGGGDDVGFGDVPADMTVSDPGRRSERGWSTVSNT